MPRDKKKGTQNTHLRNNLTISFRVFKSSTFISKNVTVLKFTKPGGLENIKYYSEKLANTKCYISTRIKCTSECKILQFKMFYFYEMKVVQC